MAGAGPAGFCAAVQAGRGGLKVALFEHFAMPGGSLTVLGSNSIDQFNNPHRPAGDRQVIAGIGWEFVKRLEREGCLAVVSGKLPFTKIIPVGARPGLISEAETEAVKRDRPGSRTEIIRDKTARSRPAPEQTELWEQEQPRAEMELRSEAELQAEMELRAEAELRAEMGLRAETELRAEAELPLHGLSAGGRLPDPQGHRKPCGRNSAFSSPGSSMTRGSSLRSAVICSRMISTVKSMFRLPPDCGTS